MSSGPPVKRFKQSSLLAFTNNNTSGNTSNLTAPATEEGEKISVLSALQALSVAVGLLISHVDQWLGLASSQPI